jgi:sugar diacid utilization regulator
MEKTISLDLVGLDGNAFALMGAFRKQARREGWDAKEIEAVMTECQSSDYDHLLQTLMKHCRSDE